MTTFKTILYVIAGIVILFYAVVKIVEWHQKRKITKR